MPNSSSASTSSTASSGNTIGGDRRRGNLISGNTQDGIASTATASPSRTTRRSGQLHRHRRHGHRPIPNGLARHRRWPTPPATTDRRVGGRTGQRDRLQHGIDGVVVLGTGPATPSARNSIFGNDPAGDHACRTAGTTTRPAPTLTSAVTAGGNTTFTGTIGGTGTAPTPSSSSPTPASTERRRASSSSAQTTVSANGTFSVTLPDAVAGGPGLHGDGDRRGQQHVAVLRRRSSHRS